MRGVYTGTTDTCLYVDALALDLAHRKISDPSQRTKVQAAARTQRVTLLQGGVWSSI